MKTGVQYLFASKPMIVLGYIILFLFVTIGMSAAQQNIPKPEFHGLYIVDGGKLIELKQQSRIREFRPGACLLMSVECAIDFSGFEVKDPKLYFILYEKKQLSMSDLFEYEMLFTKMRPLGRSRVPARDNLITDFSANNFWGCPLQIKLRSAPIKGEADMTRLVPEKPLEPGVYAVSLGMNKYDFSLSGGVKARDKDVQEIVLQIADSHCASIQEQEIRAMLQRANRDELQKYMEKFGKNAVKIMIDYLKDSDSRVRAGAATALKFFPDSEALLSSLKSEDQSFRREVIRVLARIGHLPQLSSQEVAELGEYLIYGELGGSEKTGAVGPGGCPLCHKLREDSPGVSRGPVFNGLIKRAADRVKNPNYKGKATTVAEYLAESKLCPSCFIVEGMGRNGDKESLMSASNEPPFSLSIDEMVAIDVWLFIYNDSSFPLIDELRSAHLKFMTNSEKSKPNKK